ncbi:ribonuclease H-like domain-containing protein [Tanacetum coccineum]
MDLESTQNNTIAKLPLLKQVVQTTTNADGTSTSTIPGAVTAEEMTQKRNDVKARSVLLMALPNEHKLTFNQYKDAKTLFEAIQSRLQKIVSQLSILGVNISQEDLNLKFLRSMPAEWNTHVVVCRNKPDLETMSIDDLYNNFKIVEQEVKRSISSSSNSGTTSTPVSAASTNDNAASLSNATVYAFLANQPNGSQLVHEDLEQIYDDDLKEMDLKWQLALKCRNPRSQEGRARSYDQGNRNQESTRRTVKVEEASPKAMVAIDGARFDWSFMAEEKVPTNMALMAFSDSKIQIKKFKKDKEDNLIKIDNYENASKSLDKLIRSQITDNNRKGVGYNVVPPPPTGLFAPPTIDLSNSDATKEVEKIYDAPIIKDWVSNCDEDATVKKVLKSVNVQQKPKQANEPKNVSQIPRYNRVNRNELNSKKLGVGFQFSPKACFGTGQRDVRPIWNDAMRTNHQNFSNTRRNFTPTAVLTKFGKVPISTARQSSSRAAVPVSTVRLSNTIAPKSFVNFAKFRTNAFQKTHSPPRRPFYQQIAFKNRNLKNKVNIVKLNSVNTAKAKRVTSDFGKQGINAVKISACWGDPQVALRDTGIFDSRCSMHRTWNKSYLTNYQDYDGGFVAFAGSSKGGKITGKGKIRTGNLNFEDVYFVKELKFNLFSISQMCDKKNNVLFTETECLILSPDFKLPNENQVMLKIPKKDNMYSFDLKNIVPSKAKKDETSGILKNFIIGIENQLNHKVKIIRCDNRTKFKNHEMNQFCGTKGIKREFSNARSPQQNGVAKRNNRTLIEAARTILADSLLPIPFWAEVVNTACYVQNKVLVTKPYNKTPYELLIGRAPIIGFMRPFGCLVTILNTLDHLGKFDRKVDKGVLVGYSISSKAFRIYNHRTRKVKENLHVSFLENKPNVARNRPEWLFDIESLTNTLNYQPFTARNRTNGHAVVSSPNDDVAGKKVEQEPANKEDQILKDVVDNMMNQEKESTKHSDDARSQFKEECDAQLFKGMRTRTSSANSFNTVRTPLNTASALRTSYPAGTSSEPQLMPIDGSFSIDINDYPDDPLMPELEDTAKIYSTGIFGSDYDDSPNTVETR